MTVPTPNVNAEEEDAPLLSSSDDIHPTPSSKQRSSWAFLRQGHSALVTMALVISTIFILEFGGYLMAVPAIRVWEDIICHHYYHGLEGPAHIGLGETIDEGMCKGEEVQERLNFILAGVGLGGAIVSLGTTIPYGFLADRAGRKTVFTLAMTGLILQTLWEFVVMRFWRIMPYQLLLLGPLFTLIGGGEAVATMSYYAIGADVVDESQHATVFLVGTSAALMGGVLAPAFASALMGYSTWLPLLLGLSTLILGTILFSFIPETLRRQVGANGGSIDSPDNVSDQGTSATKKVAKSPSISGIKSKVTRDLNQLRSATSVLYSPPILLLLTSFIVTPFGRQEFSLSTRYVSNRYQWTLRQAGFLLSLRAFISILLLLIIIPAISYLLTSKLHYTSRAKDLLLSRASINFLILGALLIAASPNISLAVLGYSVWTLGTGFSALTRSLITTLVDQQHVGRLYAAIATVETVGGLIAGPTVAALYAWGLKWKGGWVSLPYLCLALICLGGAVGVWSCESVGKKKNGRGESEYRDELDSDLNPESGPDEHEDLIVLEDP